MFNRNEEFLKGEVYINVEFPNGEKTSHHIGNTVQDTWTKALFQVICKGYHEPFSHTPGKITFGVENDADSLQGTKDFSVGSGAGEIALSNVYDSANDIFYVKLLLSNQAGSLYLNEVDSGLASGKIAYLQIYGSGATVPFAGGANTTSVKLTDTGDLGSNKIAITNTATVTIEYRVNLPAHAENDFKDVISTDTSNAISTYTGWGKSFLGGLCDVMTYGYVNVNSGIVGDHGFVNHAPTTAEGKDYVGNANLRITSCLLHKFDDLTVYNDGTDEADNEDEHQWNTTGGGSRIDNATVFKSAFPRTHIEILNSLWDYDAGYTAENVIASNLTVQTTATNVSVGSLQSTVNNTVDESTLNLSWSGVGENHDATLVPDLLVFYCRTVESGTKGSGATFKYNKLHINSDATEKGFVVAHVLNFDTLSGFTNGDNINASVTLQLNPT